MIINIFAVGAWRGVARRMVPQKRRLGLLSAAQAVWLARRWRSLLFRPRPCGPGPAALGTALPIRDAIRRADDQGEQQLCSAVELAGLPRESRSQHPRTPRPPCPARRVRPGRYGQYIGSISTLLMWSIFFISIYQYCILSRLGTVYNI